MHAVFIKVAAMIFRKEVDNNNNFEPLVLIIMTFKHHFIKRAIPLQLQTNFKGATTAKAGGHIEGSKQPRGMQRSVLHCLFVLVSMVKTLVSKVRVEF